MAKDKEFEKQYKRIRLSRTVIRKNKRKQARQDKIWRYGNRSDSTCPYCGGTMTWCSCCQQWSSGCCEEYGTCQCS